MRCSQCSCIYGRAKNVKYWGDILAAAGPGECYCDVQSPLTWVTHSQHHPSWGLTKTNETCTKRFEVFTPKLGIGICARFIQAGIFSHSLSIVCMWYLVGLHSPVLSKIILSLTQQHLEDGWHKMNVLPREELPNGPGSLWSLAGQSQPLLYRENRRSAANHGIHLLKVKVRAFLAAAQHTLITQPNGLAVQPTEQNTLWCLSQLPGTTYSSPAKKTFCSSLWACSKML